MTEVDVHFIAEGAERTRVEFEHRNIDRLGEGAETFRGKVDGGWATVLDNYVKAAEAPQS